jgi:hypothetical protein
LEAVTLAAVAGPSGGVAPDGSLRPVFEVLRGHADLRGQAVLGSRSSAPRDVQVTAAGGEVWLVNLTGRARRVRVEGRDGAVGLGPYAVTRLAS